MSMRKVIGLFFLLLGGYIILKTFYPGFFEVITPYAHYIKAAFPGVVLVLLGLFLLSKKRGVRNAIGVVFVVYLVLYIALPGEFRAYTFNASGVRAIEVEDVFGDVQMRMVPGDDVTVKSDERISVNREGGILTIHAGKRASVVIEVGRDAGVEDISLKNIVGSMNLEVKGRDLSISEFTGDVNVEVVELERLELSNGVGDVTIDVPSDYRVEANVPVEGSSSGEKVLKVSVWSVVGEVRVK
ncbi:hypothetical protein [Palaeococcus ferrophilus]|uniref:hypothetical protein n=1 Tax=Palaeococcus ferrophilus TaxID=83868 RepID=UPI0006979892|nr:hypothetical protein [Palaeococcus ferrophilus]